jgi:hypothetical protein
MKLNGWERIGIIASVAWVVGAGVCTLNVLNDAYLKRNAFYYSECAAIRDEGNYNARVRCANGDGSISFNECLDAYKQQHPDICSNRAQENIPSEVSNERAGAAFVAFVPLPFAWGFLYLVLFLVRWIKRGFQEA